MVQLVDLLDVQLRNLTPGGKDSAARSLNKVSEETGLHIFIWMIWFARAAFVCKHPLIPTVKFPV